ncbi:MAG: type II toxin-antitoxin system RelE/ParE family toxin [Sciscionella sp.]|nr:type II toxin-antitoxin system RelE/ParE family toxin [Sciscionella sp.]
MTGRYDVVLTSSAKHALTKLPDKVVHSVAEFIDGPLADNPHRVGKPLTSSWEGHYSARRADWRIIYRIDDRRIVVEVVSIGHRENVYRPRCNPVAGQSKKVFARVMASLSHTTSPGRSP